MAHHVGVTGHQQEEAARPGRATGGTYLTKEYRMNAHPKWLGNRTTPDDLERIAFDNGRDIEFDNELNIAVLKVSGATWYAVLSKVPA
jgi:hypothetical protein